MQGAEDEVEGSVLTYVTKTEFRKQRSRSPSCNSRSIGIGHLQSGDRCTETRPDSLDPLWVAGIGSFCSATRKGSRPNVYTYTSVFVTSCLDRCLWNGHPCGCRHAREITLGKGHPRGASSSTLHNELSAFCGAQMLHLPECHPYGTAVPPLRNRSATPTELQCHPYGTGVPPLRNCSANPTELQCQPYGTAVPTLRNWSHSLKR